VKDPARILRSLGLLLVLVLVGLYFWF